MFKFIKEYILYLFMKDEVKIGYKYRVHRNNDGTHTTEKIKYEYEVPSKYRLFLRQFLGPIDYYKARKVRNFWIACATERRRLGDPSVQSAAYNKWQRKYGSDATARISK